MTVTVEPPIAGGAVRAIASKSMAHRLLICAALSDRETRVNCADTSDDIEATARCLVSLGAEITRQGGGYTVAPIPRPVEGRRVLDCGESGSTLRFMLPITCALGAEAEFIMRGRLAKRPLSPLYEELASHGAVLSEPGVSPLKAGGQLAGGTYTIPGNISSQFISGLLLALPLLDDDSVLSVTGEIESAPYVGMTLEALRPFGLSIESDGQGYRIRGCQAYRSPGTSEVEGDWSNAAFWLSAGALCAGALCAGALCAGAHGVVCGAGSRLEPPSPGVTVTNLNRDSLQGDKAILTFLTRFGARIVQIPGGVTVSPGPLRGIDIDAGDTPDLVPVLAAVAACAEGKTVIRHAERLRIKESDRLRAVAETLKALGADATETPDGLVIVGKPRLTGGTVRSFGDHRIAMTAAVLSCACDGPVVIEGAEAVNKSYPGFFRDFAALGGRSREAL